MTSAPLTLLLPLLLAACGGGANDPADKPASLPARPATASEPAADPGAADPAGTAAIPPAGTTSPTASSALAGLDDDETPIAEALQVLENLPTQDELDAAAATRISEANADAEFERLKAEIEADLAKPPDDG